MLRHLRIINATIPVTMPTIIDSTGKPGMLVDGVVALVNVLVGVIVLSNCWVDV